MSILKELFAYRQMIKSLTLSDLRTRYKGSILGFLWTFINPLIMLLVYNVVFSTIMRTNIPHYSIFIFVGLLPWINFSTTVINGAGIIIRNANLVKKIYFPREVLPLSVVVSGIVNYLFGLIIMIPAIYLAGMRLSYLIVYFPVILFVQFIFSLAICLISSSLTVYFRDLEHILNVLVMAWFYITPIIFSTSMIPKKYLIYFSLNPLKPIIEGYQDIFYYGKTPDYHSLSIIFIISLLLLLLAMVIFRKLNKGFAEEI